MKNFQKERGGIRFLFILIVFLLTTAVASAAIEETISKTYTVRPGGKLTVDTNRGSIRIEGKKGDSIDVEIIQPVRRHTDRQMVISINSVIENEEIYRRLSIRPTQIIMTGYLCVLVEHTAIR